MLKARTAGLVTARLLLAFGAWSCWTQGCERARTACSSKGNSVPSRVRRFPLGGFGAKRSEMCI